MQIENDYDNEVYNGDIGTVDDVDINAGEIAVSFDGLGACQTFK
jgi:exodeoxyribonuclease V alpha subunit